jgi:hypothetical protein
MICIRGRFKVMYGSTVDLFFIILPATGFAPKQTLWFLVCNFVVRVANQMVNISVS